MTMRIISALVAVYWALALIAFILGMYEPGRIIIGFLIAFFAVEMVISAFSINRKEGAE